MSYRLQSHSDRNDASRFQRVPLTLFGRYMLESRREHPCQTIDMSPGEITLLAPVKARLGEKVIIHLAGMSRFVGVAVRLTETGFTVALCRPPCGTRSPAC